MTMWLFPFSKSWVRGDVASDWGPAAYCCPLGGTGSRGTANDSLPGQENLNKCVTVKAARGKNPFPHICCRETSLPFILFSFSFYWEAEILFNALL